MNINVIFFFGGSKPICRNTKYRTWYKSVYDIGFSLSSTDMKNTFNVHKLVKDGISTDEMKKIIYAFIKYYDTLKNDLFNEHKTLFIERMKNTQKLDM
ncbi:Plasmodium exported protein (PHISTa), unknown, putative [Plasmodium sp. DRC-Itaito]|nr:Plasmodium exported protein (PHISTa), unknown, putative [Plasmodium sp. DRC-Itaito]